MGPCPSENVVVDFVEGRLDGAERAAVHDHVADCSACREALAGLAPSEGELGALGPAPAGPPGRPGAVRAPGEVIGGRYRLERLLGSGGMGTVWAATHLIMKRTIALKMLRALDDASPVVRRRLLREARAASAVDHPNVVRVHDAFEADGAPMLAMDLLDGESLAQRLARRGPLDLGETARLVRPVVSAVAAAHRAGIVHRDLKPANIFIVASAGPGPDVRVLDFGVAKLLDRAEDGAQTGALTQTGEVVGTPFYMSPEQFYGERDVDGRADVWSLGVVIYECLSGRRPFSGANFGQILKRATTGDRPTLAEAAPHLPRDVTALVERMLAQDRALRPPLDAVAAVLDRHAGGAGAGPRGQRASRAWAAAALVVSAGAAATALGPRLHGAAPAPAAGGPFEAGGGVRSAGGAAPVAAAQAPPAPAEPDGVEGTWHLSANGTPLTLRVERNDGRLQGALTNEAGGSEPVSRLSWQPSTRTLNFFRTTYRQPYRAQIVDGVLVGRFAAPPPRNPAVSAWSPAWPDGYKYHVSGWNEDAVDRGAPQRVWEVSLDDEELARLRIDRAPDGRTVGRMRVYSSRSRGSGGGQPERDVEVTRWDGTALEFVARGPGPSQRFVGTAAGALLEGTFYSDAGRPLPWAGARAEVLSHGLAERPAAERSLWQERTRRRLEHLIMAGNPAPLSREAVVVEELPPIEGGGPASRDDAAPAEAAYRLRELQFTWALPDPRGGPPLARKARAYLSVPSTLAEGERRPAAIAFNGHGWGARQTMSPGGPYWYGESLARHGFVVLALDVPHHDDAPQRKQAGDAAPPPTAGPDRPNGDFEEGGGRAWDAMRALDWLLEQPFVDPARVLATGLASGGETATLVAALDARVTMAIVASFAPDLGARLRDDGHPCWRWARGDIRDYLDVADLQALVAPRPFVLETGAAEGAGPATGFAVDKQVARRARVAWADAPDRYVHYLHDGAVAFRAGAVAPPGRAAGVRTPLLTAPLEPWSTAWQTDDRTAPRAASLYALIEQLWRLRRAPAPPANGPKARAVRPKAAAVRRKKTAPHDARRAVRET